MQRGATLGTSGRSRTATTKAQPQHDDQLLGKQSQEASTGHVLLSDAGPVTMSHDRPLGNDAVNPAEPTASCSEPYAILL